MKNFLVSKTLDTPVGLMRLVASEKGLTALVWEKERPGRVAVDFGVEKSDHPLLLDAEKQLREYFDGKRQTFSLAMDFRGTDFQKKVWTALLTIPCGETRSYGEIAQQVGSPLSSRAVGAANGKNPISIIAPCHRVIGASGKMVGYGGGLENKKKLLLLEMGMTGKSRIRKYRPNAEANTALTLF